MSSRSTTDLAHQFYLDGVSGLEVAKGNVPKLTSYRKFGRNTAVGPTEEDIWNVGGLYTFPTAAETVRVKVGGNAADVDTTGAGARTIRVLGLDENWALAQEDIVLAGASASAATTTTFIRIYRAYVLTAGTYATPVNTGVITIENTTSAVVLAAIAASLGQTEMTMFTVPASTTMYMASSSVHSDSVQASDVFLWQRQSADTTSAPVTGKRLVQAYDNLTGHIQEVYDEPLVFPAKTDVWFSGAANASTASINADYCFTLETA